MFSPLDHILGAVKVRIHRCMLGKRADISFVNQYLGVGGASEIEYLVKEGIKAIVDMRAEEEDDPLELERFGIEYIKLNVQDRGIPDIDETNKVIEWIKSNLKKKNKVFIHCNLGRGRGPLMMVLYLISEGMKPSEAIMTVRKTRPYCYFNYKQLEMIRKFSQRKP